MKKECVSCCALRQELEKLREDSEQRARADHDQCVAMFQQMQELVKMNAALMRGCTPREGVDDSTCTCDAEVDKAEIPECRGGDVDDTEQTHIRRLQAIVVQQAKELEALRRSQRDTMRASRVYSVTFGNQLEEEQESRSSDGKEDGGSASDYESARCVSRSSEHASQLRKLPLTSFHARLKSKDLQLKNLQQIIAKLETRFGQIVDKKRSMAQSFQQTARTQQAHLKKYLAYIRQQTAEKKALERQVRELNQYVAVLEKKVLDGQRLGRRIEMQTSNYDGVCTNVLADDREAATLVNLPIQTLQRSQSIFAPNLPPPTPIDDAGANPNQVHMTTRDSTAGNVHFRLKTLLRLHFGATSLRGTCDTWLHQLTTLSCIASCNATLCNPRASYPSSCKRHSSVDTYFPMITSGASPHSKAENPKDTFGVFVSGSDLLASFTGAYPLQPRAPRDEQVLTARQKIRHGPPRILTGARSNLRSTTAGSR